MNFLAHIYLSGTDPEIIIGNFIGDFVKGKAWQTLPESVQKGILLHRSIDEFTDSHVIVEQTKLRLRPKYHHYAPVVSDLYYDHFLAALWTNYHPETLLTFTQDFYQLTRDFGSIIPEAAKHMLTYMSRDNWLYNYQFIAGIDKALKGMSRRTTFTSGMEHASRDLEKDYVLYQQEFEAFFPELIRHSSSFLKSLK